MKAVASGGKRRTGGTSAISAARDADGGGITGWATGYPRIRCAGGWPSSSRSLTAAPAARVAPALAPPIEIRPPSAPRAAAFPRTQRIAATTSSCGTGYATPPVHSR